MSHQEITLGLDDRVDYITGLPESWFDDGTTIHFVTVRELIDDPRTLETWEAINNQEDPEISFDEDVIEYARNKRPEGREWITARNRGSFIGRNEAQSVK